MSATSASRTRRAAVAWCLLVAWACWSSPTALQAGGIPSTDDFADVAVAVDRYIDKFGAQRVLLVLDIDNTLLAMNQDLGSDQWFEWQRYLVAHEPDSPYAVGRNFDELLEAQGLLYNLGRMHPPQPDLPVIIARMQGRGLYTLLLTSRGDEFRAATERELSRNQYDFAETALPAHGASNRSFMPYEVDDPKAAGFTSREIAAFDLTSPRPVSYTKGIMMTAGQHKGVMLLAILGRSPADIKAVVFVDDHMRHCAHVHAAAAGRGIEITSFHYNREDARVQRFQYGDKQRVHRRWLRLTRTLEEVFE